MSDKSLRFLLFGEDKTAGGMFGSLGVKAGSVGDAIGGTFHKLGAAVGGEMGELLGKVGDTFDGLDQKQMSFGQKLMAGGGLVAGIGSALQFMGSADQQASAMLAQAVQATGQSMDAYQEKIDQAVNTMHNFDFASVDTQNALRVMTQAMGDPQKALDNLSLAANLAASKHISLADAAALVDKVVSGKGAKVLAQYGIVIESAAVKASALTKAQENIKHRADDLSTAQDKLKKVQEELSGKTSLTTKESHLLAKAQTDVEGATKKLSDAQTHLADLQKAAAQHADDQAKALENLKAKTDGAAAASVDNFASKLDIVKTKVQDFVAVLGGQWGAAIQAVGAGMGIFGTVLEFVKARQAASAAAAAAATVATEAQTVATGEATVAQTGLNLAFLANPVVLIVAGIVALVAAVILAYNKVGWFHDLVNTAFHGISVAFGWIWNAAQDVFGWLKDHWQLIAGIVIGPFGLAIAWVVTHFDQVRAFASKVVDGVKTVFGKVADFITAPFRLAFDTVRSIWNAVLGGKGIHIPAIHAGPINFDGIDLTIPYLASGGTAVQPGWARVGENGPENVFLGRGASVVPLSRMNNGAGGPTIIVQPQASLATERQVQEWIAAAIEKFINNGGHIEGLT